MLRKLVFSLCLLTAGTPFLLADQVILKNGDRLTGEIVQYDGKTLKIKSAFVGTVDIQWDAVEKITSDQPLYLTLSDAQMIVGTMSAAGSQVEIRTTQTGTVAVARESIQSIRSKPAYDAYQAELERLRNPDLLELWSGSANVGLSLSSGNADTTNLAMGVAAARTTKRDKISVYANSLYAKNTTNGVALTTANAIRGGGRYDFNVSARAFAFGLSDLEYDEFQKLDLRMTLGGGMGWHTYKTERTTFDVFGGGGYTKEYFSTNLRRSSGNLLLGEELAHKLSSRTFLKEQLVLLPNLSDTGEYRLNFDLGTVTNLNTWLGWQLTFSDRYLSNPIPGTKSNDLLFTTGLRVTFGK